MTFFLGKHAIRKGGKSRTLQTDTALKWYKYLTDVHVRDFLEQ